jgi:hypothetical protein
MGNVLFRRIPLKNNCRLKIGDDEVVFNNAGISIAISDFGTALIDDFVLSKDERTFYKKCKKSKIPKDAWSIWSEIADTVPSHDGLQKLITEGALFRRVTENLYVFHGDTPSGWNLHRATNAILAWS